MQKKHFIILGIVAGAVLLFLVAKVVLETGQNSVKICHSTSSEGNPYVVNNPNKSGNVNGHDDHDGGIFPDDPWGDIIPPFTWYSWFNPPGPIPPIQVPHLYPGKNWNNEGQAIWNNDCGIPEEPEPTPTEVPTPTPIQCNELTYTCGECEETPNDDYCGEWKFDYCQRNYECSYGEDEDWNCECKGEEPTPTPSPEPTPTERPLTPAGAPVCNAPAVTKAPLYDWDSCTRTDEDTVTCSWGVTDGHAQSYGIYYGIRQDNLPWYTEVKGHDSTTATLNLVPQGHIWTKICSIGTCGDQVCGSVVDP